jgi:hypothetical protein
VLCLDKSVIEVKGLLLVSSVRLAVKVLNSMRSRLVITERGCHPKSDGNPAEVKASRGQRLQTIFGNLAKTMSSGARQLASAQRHYG